jgi:MoaA/NifB/PqqE/SkfB family radical SAM enzyme
MTKIHYARVNDQKEIVLPHHMAKELGIVPGDEIRIDPNGHGFYLHPSISTLKRVYIELTNTCNLNCSTCMRNVWEVQYGSLSGEAFEHILSDLETFPQKPELFFGGYGEPLANPACLDMLEHAKKLGYRVSLITNGLLLTERVTHRLVEMKLDMLWVSLDGASPDCYADVRLGNALPLVLQNLACLRAHKYQIFGPSNWGGFPKLGIAFVAMQRNIHDLDHVIKLGIRLGAMEFSITNVLAHNRELLDENLYMRSANLIAVQDILPLVHMPRMDVTAQTTDAILSLLKRINRLEFFGSELNQNTDECPFVERGSMAIRWDGKVSPCLPLLYTHSYYLDERKRTSREYFVGNLHENHLLQIWNAASYRTLRKQLQDFDFSPCVFCNSCEMASENLEDCFGNVQPACGGCLWARGLIRCP